MLLFVFPITHQSIASDDYKSNSEKDEITFELNVNINMNGSRTKEVASGNLQFGLSHNKTDKLVLFGNKYSIWYDI